ERVAQRADGGIEARIDEPRAALERRADVRERGAARDGRRERVDVTIDRFERADRDEQGISGRRVERLREVSAELEEADRHVLVFPSNRRRHAPGAYDVG